MKKIIGLSALVVFIIIMLIGCAGNDNNEAINSGNNGNNDTGIATNEASGTTIQVQDEPWADPTPEDAFEFSNGTITKYIGDYKIVRIPRRIGGAEVTAIGDSAFESNKIITELYLPSNVKKIGDKAFYFAENLTVLHLGEAETVNDDAFNMTRLKTITLSPNLKTIGERAFALWAHAGSEEPVVDIVIPASVTFIGERAFSTDWFRTFTFEGTKLPTMETGSLSGARSGRTVFVNDSYTEDEALAVMKALYSAGMSSSAIVQRMNGTALFVDYSDDYEYDLVGGRGARINKYIGSSDTLVIPLTMGGQPVYQIGANAFEGNETIRVVILPDELEIIYGYAFKNCINLESVDIPDSVYIIGPEAFNGTVKLKSVNISAEEISYGAFMKSGIESVVIGDRTTEIGSSVFRDCVNLKNVTMGKNVREIGYEAFGGCKSLEAIDFLPESLRVIGDYAFNDCWAVDEIRIPEGVREIGNWAFRRAGQMYEYLEIIRDRTYTVGNAFVSDPETEIGNGKELLVDERYPKWVNVYLPSTLEYMGWEVFSRVDIDGLHLPPGLREVSQLQEFEYSLDGICCLVHIYADAGTTQQQIDALNEYLSADEEIIRATWWMRDFDLVGDIGVVKDIVIKYEGKNMYYTKS